MEAVTYTYYLHTYISAQLPCDTRRLWSIYHVPLWERFLIKVAHSRGLKMWGKANCSPLPATLPFSWVGWKIRWMFSENERECDEGRQSHGQSNLEENIRSILVVEGVILDSITPYHHFLRVTYRRITFPTVVCACVVWFFTFRRFLSKLNCL